MNEKKTAKWSGWVMATAFLAIAGILSISGEPRLESRVSTTAKGSQVVGQASSEASVPARAEVDVCEVQLD